MNSSTYCFSLLSTGFPHGAYQTQNFNRPELRAPSVKGMIRWWHRALGYSETDAQAIFGSIANGRNQASLVAFRINTNATPSTRKEYFMPHKGRRGGEKEGILPGTTYELTLIERRGGLSVHHRQQLERATKAWLMLGSIGQRSNRAAGSILWDDCPQEIKTFEIEASTLLEGSRISFAILNQTLENESHAREIAGDFLADQAFHGMAPFGSAKPDRKPSPIKLKCVYLDDSLRLLAVWDHRTESPNNLTRGVQTLVKANKEIGILLESALPKLIS